MTLRVHKGPSPRGCLAETACHRWFPLTLDGCNPPYVATNWERVTCKACMRKKEKE